MSQGPEDLQGWDEKWGGIIVKTAEDQQGHQEIRWRPYWEWGDHCALAITRGQKQVSSASDFYRWFHAGAHDQERQEALPSKQGEHKPPHRSVICSFPMIMRTHKPSSMQIPSFKWDRRGGVIGSWILECLTMSRKWDCFKLKDHFNGQVKMWPSTIHTIQQREIRKKSFMLMSSHCID